MGSTGADTFATEQEELTVLITGFSPFKKDYPVNPAWEIASRLRDYLPPVRAKKPYSPSDPILPPIRLLVHPEPVRVNYQVVRGLVPELWNLDSKEDAEGNTNGWGPKPTKIDFAIHIGMAGPRPFYCIERRGHRDGYALKDVDGEFLGDQNRRVKEGKDWVWDGVPKELLSDLDVDDVLERWKKHSPEGSDLRISEDAGHFLCDFIYFSSLAHLYKAGERRRVVFLHVPCEGSEAQLATGTGLAYQLIRSIAESEVVRRARTRKEAHEL
ncbi:putative pyroglutamyl peptidase type I [Diplogelasinospora grovesii]|uniref:Pyroglutamyl peptidase type I n=1 Tax=Diplogelasinospora grovesii TaxID=303347 RepID=A0AAN6N968_9PEZI|nr:putative pyroglutamyl peptidase type I [Diplogelasinospora grovesii]